MEKPMTDKLEEFRADIAEVIERHWGTTLSPATDEDMDPLHSAEAAMVSPGAWAIVVEGSSLDPDIPTYVRRVAAPHQSPLHTLGLLYDQAQSMVGGDG